MDAKEKLRLAKWLVGEVFTSPTPAFHLEILDFLEARHKFSLISLFRGASKTTLINKLSNFLNVYINKEPYTQIFSSNEFKAVRILHDVKAIFDVAIKKGLNVKRGEFWGKKEIEIIVDGKPCFLEALGAGQDPRSSSYRFSRPTLQVFDDIESKVGLYAIANKSNREKLRSWFFDDCLPALDVTGRVIFIGTVLHREGLISTLMQRSEWSHFVQPILKDGHSVWSSRFPDSASDARALECEILEKTGKKTAITSIEDLRALYAKNMKGFYQEYLCAPQSEDKAFFKDEYFRYFDGVVYSQKVQVLSFSNAIEEHKIIIKEPIALLIDGKRLPISDFLIYTSLDLASDGKDNTVFATCAYDSAGRMFVLDITAGHFNPFIKSLEAVRIQKTFNPLRFGIEKAGAQNDFFYNIDLAQKEFNVRIPVEVLSHRGVNKNIRISNLHPLFLAGKIFFNKELKNLDEVRVQFLSFDLEIQGTDDILDALAYQLDFIKNRSFGDDDDITDDGGAWL